MRIDTKKRRVEGGEEGENEATRKRQLQCSGCCILAEGLAGIEEDTIAEGRSEDEDSDEEKERNSKHMFQIAKQQYMDLLAAGDSAIFPCMNPRKLQPEEIRFRAGKLILSHASDILRKCQGVDEIRKEEGQKRARSLLHEAALLVRGAPVQVLEGGRAGVAEVNKGGDLSDASKLMPALKAVHDDINKLLSTFSSRMEEDSDSESL
mmetsp:Transcript_20548/g.52786  ORF Transcript_20548/g.52786 Transcript_20548/m.52786 type:complete len:207 (-) Transcript_20548:1645-2265(-)